MKSKEIKTLLLVLFTGIGAALMLAIGMLKIYNPEGNYLAGNLLLTPQNAFSLEYTEPGAKGRTEMRFKFKEIVLTSFNQSSREWITKSLSRNEYESFYSMIKNDSSLSESSPLVESYFTGRIPAKIELKVSRLASDTGIGSEQNFSEAVFSEQGDYYRLLLRQTGGVLNWVYFKHPGIYSKVLKLAGENQ